MAVGARLVQQQVRRGRTHERFDPLQGRQVRAAAVTREAHFERPGSCVADASEARAEHRRVVQVGQACRVFLRAIAAMLVAIDDEHPQIGATVRYESQSIEGAEAGTSLEDGVVEAAREVHRDAMVERVVHGRELPGEHCVARIAHARRPGDALARRERLGSALERFEVGLHMQSA